LDCNITIFDKYSKVDAESVRYSISKNGTENYSEWRKISLKHLDEYHQRIITLSCSDTFAEGSNNYIRWSISDTAGNSIISDDYQLKIDASGCVFNTVRPEKKEWVNDKTVECSIIITDILGSGINKSTIKYITTTGRTNHNNKWRTVDLEIIDLDVSEGIETETLGPSSVLARIEIEEFEEGSKNYIYWRANDMVDYGIIEVGPFNINIDRSPLEFNNPSTIAGAILYDLHYYRYGYRWLGSQYCIN
jgi:hypothetical protein